MLAATSAMVGRIFPHGGDRVKVSENFGATVVAPVVPVDTSLFSILSNFNPSLEFLFSVPDVCSPLLNENRVRVETKVSLNLLLKTI